MLPILVIVGSGYLEMRQVLAFVEEGTSFYSLGPDSRTEGQGQVVW